MVLHLAGSRLPCGLDKTSTFTRQGRVLDNLPQPPSQPPLLRCSMPDPSFCPSPATYTANHKDGGCRAKGLSSGR